MSHPISPKTIYLADYQPSAYLIDTVDLVFYLYPNTTRVRSKLTVRRNPERTEGGDLHLDGVGLTPVWVRLNGSELSAGDYQVNDQSLTICNPPESFVLETEVEVEPEKNTLLEGLYKSSGMYCTQCEAEGFRRITWYLDRPDIMASFRVRIEANAKQYPVLLSNGNPGEKGTLAEGRHYAEWHDPHPKPCYLFALVAGDLQFIEDQHVTTSGKEVTLRIFVEQENIKKCDHAMRSLIKSMLWDEQQYGREYDLSVYNIVAANDFNMGAMENKGLNVFNSKYVLANQETATDQDFLGIESVIAHEYFHNWTGNRVTCRDWFQLSLKEGFTVFRDQEFSADLNSRDVCRIQDVRRLRATQFAEDAGPMSHSVRPASYMEINNFYTTTIYEKGAEVVRMQAHLLGAEKFRAATDLYFERFDGQAVTTSDFVQCMADTSARDMQQFKNWYDYAGTPEIKAAGSYDTAAKTYTLSFEQNTPDTPAQENKPAFDIPVAIGLLDAQGKDLLPETVLELTQKKQEFVVQNIDVAPVPSLFQ